VLNLLKAAIVTIAAAIAAAFFVVPLYFAGYISREMVVAVSPDGSTQAVCRGWYPHGMEYELWLRRQGELFGRKVGAVGSETMGRCAAVAWSPDGSRIAAATTGGWVTMWDAKAKSADGHLRLDDLVYRGENERPYSTPNMVRGIAFESDTALRVATCERLWARTRRSEDIVTCANADRSDVVAIGGR